MERFYTSFFHLKLCKLKGRVQGSVFWITFKSLLPYVPSLCSVNLSQTYQEKLFGLFRWVPLSQVVLSECSLLKSLVFSLLSPLPQFPIFPWKIWESSRTQPFVWWDGWCSPVLSGQSQQSRRSRNGVETSKGPSRPPGS